MIVFINAIPFIKKLFPSYTLQLGGLIGNTSFLGIPISLALLPTYIINFTIGFDLGTTFFAWIFGPFLLKEKEKQYPFLNFKRLSLTISNSPATKGIIGVLIIYLLNLENVLVNVLWIPAKFVIYLAIIVVGTRLGVITSKKNKLFLSLFKGLKNVYGTYSTKSGKHWQIKGMVIEKIIYNHLIGKQPYGFYPLINDKTSVGIADFDDHNPLPAIAFIKRAAHYGLNAYLEKSKSKGYHVWLFFSEEGVSARKLRIVMKYILDEIEFDIFLLSEK